MPARRDALREARRVPLIAAFVRRRGQRDHVYVTRADGSECDWAFPSYGDHLPHDLCHLVIEDCLQIVKGFWGLVEQGMEVVLVDNHVTLISNGRPLSAQPNVDLADLRQAEEAVALLGPTAMQFDQAGAIAVARLAEADRETRLAPGIRSALGSALGFTLPSGVSEKDIVAAQTQLHDLAGRWRELADGEAITCTFTRSKS